MPTSHTGQDPTRIPTRRQLDKVHEAALECLRTALTAKRLIIPWAVPVGNRDKKMSDLKRLQTELENALQRFDEVWTADVACWFYLYRPNPDARFGEYLTAAEHVRDCSDKALFAAGTAIEVGVADLEEARSVLRLDRPSVTEAILHDEWSLAYRNLEFAGERTAEANVLAGGDGANGKRSEGDGSQYGFECGTEIVRVYGCGESVALERTEGVERLIAIVTRRQVNVMELARIGSAQEDRSRSSVDIDADRLSERESVNDERFESRLGDDAPSAVREAISDLIAQRDAAATRGDEQEAAALTAQINAALQCGKAALQAAAGTVRRSLDRTYDRLREGEHGTTLAKHFDQFVTRPRKESEYVYSPDESHGKIDWYVK